MSDELSERSFMDCQAPWLQTAWCDACDAVLQEEGCWNDRSEGFAKVLFVCEGCSDVIRCRNAAS